MGSKDRKSAMGKVGSGKLGFIGLGYMGSRIAKRLLGAGYLLVVFNRIGLRRKHWVLMVQ